MAEKVTASVHKHRRTTLERIEKYISDTYFTDVNLRGKLYPHSKPIDGIYHWALPGGEGKWQDFSFSYVVAQDFKPTKVGETFGPTWSTHWFKVEVNIPENWIGQEVWMRWKSQSEAMIWSESGRPLQGLSTGISHQMRSDYRISECWQASGKKSPLVYYIEMACNNMFGAGKDGMINPPDADRSYKLEMGEICTVDKQIHKLLLDLEVLHDMAKKLPSESRGYEALYCGNHIINTIIQGDLGLASKIADNFFSKKNGSCAHTLALMGHCHIDSAWLWPYSETKRKCARSWASTLQLMDDYPEMNFTCSQAQQFDWVKTHYPELYSRIKTKVMEGRFIPVGGTWVEMDGLIPSGESFMRQFLYGQRFFQKEFGKTCKEFWLPDTFGYSAQFPQICKQFGINRFLTQKLSWSLVNKFPHHNFLWEGLDGSTILAHFPPGDSYEMNVTVDEALRTVNNLEDKGRVNTSAFLYGFGDGGGGPTANMLERARRLQDVDGCPKMVHMSSDDFFQHLESVQRNLCRWVGELYLELHNGTYTSQANTKRQNRECEFVLRDAEMFLALASIQDMLERNQVLKFQVEVVDAWKKVLLNQFHDVIPGSSIGIVYKDSDRLFQEALDCATKIRDTCLELIVKGMDKNPHNEEEVIVVNSLPWPMSKVIKVHGKAMEEPSVKRRKVDGTLQTAKSGGYYIPVITNSGASVLEMEEEDNIEFHMENGEFILKNRFMKAVITKYGVIKELKSPSENPTRDVFQSADGKCGNQLMLYDDIPLFWDAWDTMDYHLETGRILNDDTGANILSEVEVVENGPLVVRLQWQLRISESSSLKQEIEMTNCNPYLTFHTQVDWHENRKFLKVAFNTGLLARKVTFDTQFGYLERSTHTNTSWESAKYEVCGHKWADLSEYDFGVSVFNDSKYGWTARGSILSLSLLKSPKAPDDKCDMGSHSFKYAIMPHEGTFQEEEIPAKAYEFNSELLVLSLQRTGSVRWFLVSGHGIMIEAIKLSEDDPKKVVVRLFEMYGATTTTELQIPAPLCPVSAHLCNGLEESISPLVLDASTVKDNGFYSVELHFTPFKIVNVLLSYGKPLTV